MLKILVKLSNYLSNLWTNISGIKQKVFQPKIFSQFGHYLFSLISFNTE